MRGPPPRRSSASRRSTGGLLKRLSPASSCVKRCAMNVQRRRSLTLVLCCVAQFMVVLDVAIVNVALPSIARDLGFTSASLAWVVNAYTLTFAGFLLLGGRAADLLGRREVLAAGLALFARRVAGRRPRAELVHAGRRARRAGAGRRDRRAGHALDPDHDVHRGRRAQPRARPLGRDGRDRRRVGRSARRRAHRGAELALDPLRQHPDRAPRGGRRAPRGRDARAADAAAARDFDLLGALTGDGGPRRRDLRHHRDGALRLGLRADAAHDRRRLPRCSRPSSSSRVASPGARSFRCASSPRARCPPPTSSSSSWAARCSRCGTSSRSTSRRCSATRRSRPAWPWPRCR